MKKPSQALFLTLLMVASAAPSYSTQDLYQDRNDSETPGMVTRCKNAVNDTAEYVNQTINNLHPLAKVLAAASLVGMGYLLAPASAPSIASAGVGNMDLSANTNLSNITCPSNEVIQNAITTCPSTQVIQEVIKSTPCTNIAPNIAEVSSTWWKYILTFAVGTVMLKLLEDKPSEEDETFKSFAESATVHKIRS